MSSSPRFQHGLLLKTPEALARFFKDTPSLNKVQLGDWLSDPDPFQKAVMHAFVELFDFHNLSFDDAIREFLSSLRLPGEAQRIDRLMEKLAECYHRHNPGIFSTADTAYVLAFSVIMLNTDAHNDQVKNKMTQAQFMSSLRGIDNGKDIDPAFLIKLYDRIVTKEIKMKDDPLGLFVSCLRAPPAHLSMPPFVLPTFDASFL